MPKKAPAPFFTRTSLVNLFTVPAITGVLVLIGFYFVTKDTLDRHTTELNSLKTILPQVSKEDRDARDKFAEEERKARDDVRKAFMDNQLKTTEVLGQLSARLLVGENKQEITNQTLNKIVDELSRIQAVSSRR